MERVQFQQEQMLAELKDLVDKGLFTVAETKMILKKRTEFEGQLVRRVAKKGDYLRYLKYEMELEELRRKRVERMNKEKGPTTVSDYAIVKRQYDIFERALKRFKSDVGMWMEYINVAKRNGARALVGRVCARAIQMHPNVPGLYIVAAEHELGGDGMGNFHAARRLLQRGIRMNGESAEIWNAYIALEKRFAATLRERWTVLGITEAEAERIAGGAIVREVVAEACKAVPESALSAV